MINIRKINPMVRAVGTMGAIAALAGGVTFAALQSNSVVLADNTLSSASAALSIGSGSNCSNATNASTPGFTNTKLVPGTASDPVNFCLKNTGDVSLALTANVADTLGTGAGKLDPSKVKLDFDCSNGGTGSETLSVTLADLAGTTPQALGSDELGASDQWDCAVTATLDADVTSTGNVGPFGINFVGTEPTSTTPTEPTTPVTTPTDNTPTDQ